MIRNTVQPLESYRLANYSEPINCHICGASNTQEAEFCIQCLAPMALAHQANSPKTRPQLMAVVGAAAAGKTVYLGMLMDMLSRQSEPVELLARGAFSITLQQVTLSSLARCEFPPKTPNEPDRWNWVHCQVWRAGKPQPMELIMPDMPGEAILEEVDHPHTYRVIRAFLQQCAGIMVLIDTVKLREGTSEQDYFTMKLLSYLSELSNDSQRGRSDQPVALIFSKADQCEECLEDPAAYAEAHAGGLWQHCRERFPCHKFFAAGVAGACAWYESTTNGRVQVPLRIEPRGVVEPFLWLLERLTTKRKAI
jgi:hypothetical protein